MYKRSFRRTINQTRFSSSSDPHTPDAYSIGQTVSKRPTTQRRINCEAASNAVNGVEYSIIGDTAAATLYARRLLNNGVIQPINLINEGIDRTNVEYLEKVSFPATHNKIILQYLIAEQVHLMNSVDEATPTFEDDKIITYYVGASPVGDLIATYFSPRVGPWFPSNSNQRIQPFVTANTITRDLTAKEKLVSNILQNTWHIPSTTSVVVKTPSILSIHYIFMNYDKNSDSYTRNLFLSEFSSVSQAGNVDVIFGAKNLKFIPTNVANIYNITGTDSAMDPIPIVNSRLVWKTNVYTYLRLAADGGLDPKPVFVPTFYRSRRSIPISALTVNNASSVKSACSCDPSLTPSDSGPSTFFGDLITSYLAFSLYDLNSPKHNTITWLVQVYTTPEDLSVVDQAGAYADPDHNFLIVEAICIKNKRVSSYDTTEQEVKVIYNDPDTENRYLTQFGQIVSTVNQAYTGEPIPPSTLIQDFSACDTSGACTDAQYIVDYSTRESPLSIVLQLITNLYGTELYINPGSLSC